MPADQDASKGYDPTAEEYYHGYGCTIVSTGQKIPIAAEFTESKQAPEETAMRVTCDALAVEKPIWMLGDSAYDTLGWHDHLLAAGGRASRSVQRTKHRRSERHRVQGRSPHRRTQRGRSAEAIDARRGRTTAGVESNEPTTPSRTAASGTFCARGRVHARAQVFLALCLRLVIAITNDERGDNPGSTVITL